MRASRRPVRMLGMPHSQDTSLMAVHREPSRKGGAGTAMLPELRSAQSPRTLRSFRHAGESTDGPRAESQRQTQRQGKAPDALFPSHQTQREDASGIRVHSRLWGG